MSALFREAEVFPIIVRLIRQECTEATGFISHQAITSALLEDGEAKALIAQAHQNQEGDQSREWIASNMVAWFSQRITIGRSAWTDSFERVKVDGNWAYKPSNSQSGDETT